MRFLLVLAAVLVTAMVEAREIGGLSLSDEAVVGGERLQLNGGGIRSKLFIRVYVAGLYTVRP